MQAKSTFADFHCFRMYNQLWIIRDLCDVWQERLPFNMRIVNLNNLPSTQTVYRTNYRSHSTACVRAKWAHFAIC